MRKKPTPARKVKTKKKRFPAVTIENLKKRDEENAKKHGHPLNTHAKKFTKPEERAMLLKAVVAHLESGLSRDCFVEADWDTVERLCSEYPTDFPAADITAAIKKGRQWWETLGKAGSAGKIKGFCPSAWKFNMQNRALNGSAGDANGRWRDSISAELTGKDGSPITTFNVGDYTTPAAAKAAYDKMTKG